jgi:hypothetical protein
MALFTPVLVVSVIVILAFSRLSFSDKLLNRLLQGIIFLLPCSQADFEAHISLRKKERDLSKIKPPVSYAYLTERTLTQVIPNFSWNRELIANAIFVLVIVATESSFLCVANTSPDYRILSSWALVLGVSLSLCFLFLSLTSKETGQIEVALSLFRYSKRYTNNYRFLSLPTVANVFTPFQWLLGGGLPSHMLPHGGGSKEVKR